MKKPTLISKGSITQKELEDGIWQFVIDHGRRIKDNMWIVRFGISTKDDLLRRIYSRATGIYRIKDEDKIDREILRSGENYLHNIRRWRIADEREAKINRLPKMKKWIIISLRRIANYLIKKWL